jgi:hypothetical protein
MVTSQAQRLSARLPLATQRSADQPRVIIPSALQLTKQQEDDLIEHAKRRLRELSNDLGRYDYNGTEWIGQSAPHIKSGKGLPFMARRHLAHLIYQQRVEWREKMLGAIWKQSNIHLPLTRRTTQQQIARSRANFFGSEPWMSVNAVGNSDVDFAKKASAWSSHEATEAEVPSVLGSTIDLTFIQGEQVTKNIYDKKYSYYKSFDDVAVDAQGQPIIALDGNYIRRTDTFVQLDPNQGSQSPMVLARDGQTPQPQGELTFATMLLDRRLTIFEGAKVKNIHFMDFLFPLTAPDLESADCLIHLYSEPVITLMSRLLSSEWQQADTVPSPEDQLKRIAELGALLMPGAGDTQRPAADQARPELNEAMGATGRDNIEPVVSLAEVWVHYDVHNDGNLASVMILMDKDGRVPIHYNYAANLTWNGKRPFEMHTINKVDGRAHGQGQVESYFGLQQFADLLINRWNFHQMSSARVDFWNPSMVVEGDNNPNLKVNWGGTYTLKPSATAAQALSSVVLPDVKGDQIYKLLQLVIQMMDTMSGVSNVNTANMAGLDQGNLATGIRNMESSNEELSGQWLNDLRPSITRTMNSFFGLTLAHLDKPRVFKYFEYDETVQDFISRSGQFTVEDARDLTLDVDLQLSRTKPREDEAQAKAAWDLGMQYYTAPLPPQAQGPMAMLGKQLLQVYKVRNPERILVPQAAAPPPELPPGLPPPQGSSQPEPAPSAPSQ